MFRKNFKNKKILAALIIISSLSIAGGFMLAQFNDKNLISNPIPTILPEISTEDNSQPETINIPREKTLSGGIHVFQTFNNCGPAAFSMALSYYGINITQQELGNILRPYQIASGDNDDKSVTLEEIAEKSKEYGFIPFRRPVGNPEIVKQFIANDIPVITRTWLTEDEDIGHYRVIKGYDENGFIQDDSLQGKDLFYTFEEYDAIWKQFNYEYLVLVPGGKENIAREILRENYDEKIAWQNAVDNAKKALTENPNDIHAGFNLSVALFETGDYEESIREFEKVEDKLSFRTLWYQIEPIRSYYETQNYDRVFAITDRILNNQNRAFSELYIIRGDIYKNQGNIETARTEYEKAIQYNTNMKAARDSLDSVL